MKHLSALDAVFLHLETPETPMHVGSLMLLDRPPGRKTPYAAIRAHVARRLHLAPVFFRKLGFMPLDLANPVWLHDNEIDLEYHIRRLKLSAPGTAAQLEDAVAGLHEALLHRSRPLWQFTVIDGLDSGQVAFYAKIHHAALDGQGGVAVAHALLDAQQTPARRRPRPGQSRSGVNSGGDPIGPPPTPVRHSAIRMLGAALRNTVAQYGRIAKGVPEVVRAAARAALWR